VGVRVVAADGPAATRAADQDAGQRRWHAPGVRTRGTCTWSASVPPPTGGPCTPPTSGDARQGVLLSGLAGPLTQHRGSTAGSVDPTHPPHPAVPVGPPRRVAVAATRPHRSPQSRPRGCRRWCRYPLPRRVRAGHQPRSG
jgi:hypothetical protein